jgi:tRNA threonylcarbamoyl adenosine modification protein YjeE
VITVCTVSAEQTRQVGVALAGALRPGDVVCLTGALGAGKTTLAQGVAAGLGVKEPVTSPTFVLVRPYECAPLGSAANPTQVSRLLHADLYRLEHTTELADLAIDELVEDGAAALVEWGDVVAPLLAATVTVVLVDEGGDPDSRVVSVTLPEERHAEAAALRARLDGSRVGG